jgi:prepilin-type N-terminal cleavage/methylation domain-containing protein
MKYSHRARGFTLIELLVVIAIIGILSSVVLASLNTARVKSRDAAMISDMDSFAAQAAIYHNDNGSYGDTAGASDCSVGVFSDPTFQGGFTAIDGLNGGGTRECYATSDQYAVVVQRPSTPDFAPPTTYYCLDTSRRCGIDDISGIAAATSCNCP